LAENAEMVVLWGANFVSQANTTKYVADAKARGAKIVCIDVRKTEAMAVAETKLVLRPGSDAALALAMMHVLIRDGLTDPGFIAEHTVGFDDLAPHVAHFTPEWAAAETGLMAEQIEGFARAYGTTRPATIVAGGSSLHKGRNSWLAARAIACLPALVGDYGVPGGGMGPRHGVHATGRGLNDVTARERRAKPQTVPG
ncbi:MAG: molybdopterin-dependent oxidoreductase, partial [Pseudomonadota bacterium]